MKPPKGPPYLHTGSKPFKKSTNAEVQRRVDAVEELWSRGYKKHQIHTMAGQMFGVDWRQTDRYLTRAREQMMTRLKRSRDEHRIDALSFYEGIIASQKHRTHEKLLARRRIDELLGLDEPRRTEVSGLDGEPVKVETHAKSLRPSTVRKAIREKIRRDVMNEFGIAKGNRSPAGSVGG